MIRVLDSAGSTLVEWGRQQLQHPYYQDHFGEDPYYHDDVGDDPHLHNYNNDIGCHGDDYNLYIHGDVSDDPYYHGDVSKDTNLHNYNNDIGSHGDDYNICIHGDDPYYQDHLGEDPYYHDDVGDDPYYQDHFGKDPYYHDDVGDDPYLHNYNNDIGSHGDDYNHYIHGDDPIYHGDDPHYHDDNEDIECHSDDDVNGMRILIMFNWIITIMAMSIIAINARTIASVWVLFHTEIMDLHGNVWSVVVYIALPKRLYL